MILKFPFLSLNTQFGVRLLPCIAVPRIIIKREDYISCSCNCSRMCFLCFYWHFNVLWKRIPHKIRISNNKTTWCVELYLSCYLHECTAPLSTLNKEGAYCLSRPEPSKDSTHRQLKADKISRKYNAKQIIDIVGLKYKWKQIDWLKNDLNPTAIGRGVFMNISLRPKHSTTFVEINSLGNLKLYNIC